MRKRMVAILAYAGAILTLVIAVLVPFYLMGAFSGLVSRAGLHIDPAYSGGTVARTIERTGYRIVVYNPVQTHALQRVEPFVQIVFKPADALPAQVDENLDLNGDGRTDVRVTFAADQSPDAKLRGNVVALNGNYETMTGVADDSFTRMLVRVNNSVIVRVPFHSTVAQK